MKLICESSIAKMRYESERVRLKLDEDIKAPPRNTKNPLYSRAEVRIYIDRTAHGIWPQWFHCGGSKLSVSAAAEVRAHFQGKVEEMLLDEFIDEWNANHR